MNKFATITIRREGSGPEIFMGLIVEEGTTHIKCLIPDREILATTYPADIKGEWFARNSKAVSCVPHNN